MCFVCVCARASTCMVLVNGRGILLRRFVSCLLKEIVLHE
jgi:hypothetical protein